MRFRVAAAAADDAFVAVRAVGDTAVIVVVDGTVVVGLVVADRVAFAFGEPGGDFRSALIPDRS